MFGVSKCYIFKPLLFITESKAKKITIFINKNPNVHPLYCSSYQNENNIQAYFIYSYCACSYNAHVI